MSLKISDKSVLTFSPILGRHYLVARGNTVTREIFYDEKTPPPKLPISPLIPFFEKIFTFPFHWKTLMSEEEAISKGLRPIITYQRDMVAAGETKGSVEPQKMCIVARSVTNQHYLLDREVHPIEMDVTSADGPTVKLVFTYTVQIHDMKLLLAKFPGGNFLDYAENMVTALLRVKLPQKKFDEIRGVSKGADGNAVGLQDDLDVIKDQLNDGEFKTMYGFEFLKIMHEYTLLTPAAAAFMAKVQEKATSEIEVGIAQNKAAAEVTLITEKGSAETAVIAKRKNEIGTLENKLAAGKVTMVGAAEIDILGKKVAAITPLQNSLNETAKAIARSLGQTKGTVVINGDQLSNSDLVRALVANEIITKKTTDEQK